MCDQKDISLETAAQIVIAGLQSGQIKLPCANCFDEKDKQKQVEKRVAVLQGTIERLDQQAMSDLLDQARREVSAMNLMVDASYLRALVFAIAGKELPKR